MRGCAQTSPSKASRSQQNGAGMSSQIDIAGAYLGHMCPKPAHARAFRCPWRSRVDPRRPSSRDTRGRSRPVPDLDRHPRPKIRPYIGYTGNSLSCITCVYVTGMASVLALQWRWRFLSPLSVYRDTCFSMCRCVPRYTCACNHTFVGPDDHTGIAGTPWCWDGAKPCGW